MSGWRLSAGNRRPLGFTFDGRRYSGLEGDTLAAALLAGGVRIVGRSFKRHRPRGIFAAGLEEPNALVTVGAGGRRTVNLRATEVELHEGLVATSQNAWPSVRCDLGRINDWLAPLIPAGFHHKTFMWPSWKLYEPLIRHAAGLGRIEPAADEDRYDKRFAHCDVLVVGAGTAGLAAARTARQAGEDVLVIDRHADLHDGISLLPRATALGWYDGNLVTAVQQLAGGQRLWKIRARRVVLANGATERPLAFPGNDKPGVMLASAARKYAERYGVAAGRRVLVFTNNDSAYESALAMQALGVPVVALVDVRAEPPQELRARLSAAGIAQHAGSAIERVRGWAGVRAVEISGVGRIDCDAVAVSGGWNPNLQLYCQAGGKLRWDDRAACFVPERCEQPVEWVGEVPAHRTQPYWRTPGRANEQFVDLLHDVTVADVELAAREGFSSVEHLKRYTAAGMAVDQGKTSSVNAIGVLGEITGRAPGEVGTTTFRPPYHPVTIGALAGRRVDELAQRYRRLPVTAHESLGGVLEDHSGWLRPAFYLRPGESERAAIEREVHAARNAVALFDSSSLGKIEVFGRDAAEFLNRVYVNNVRTLKPGRLRYGLMLGENGVIKDDGVCACLAPDRYVVCTSSAGARDIHFWMEEWLQCEWPDLAVHVEPQSAQWATLTVSGPHARALVAELDIGIDLSPDAFPHMHVREGRLGKQAVRVRRASFTGEQSFEIDIAANHADSLWQRLLELGAPFGITPLGMEALDVLRVEKGFLEVGVDTDGETTPLDVGWGEAIAKKPDDFIGRRSLALPAFKASGRLQLVGLLPDEASPLPVGTHAFDASGALLGHVTSSCESPTLRRTVAMARLRDGAGRMGETVMLDTGGQRHSARIADRAFYDRQGARLNG